MRRLPLVLALALALTATAPAAAADLVAVTGTVTGAAGPVAGARVSAYQVTTGGPQFTPSTTTAADGTYQLLLDVGDQLFAVDPPAGSGEGFSDRTVTLTGGAPTTVDLRLAAHAGGTGDLDGNATWPDGTPAAGVAITAAQPPAPPAPPVVRRTRTDAAGHWALPGVPAGRWDVQLSIGSGSDSHGEGEIRTAVAAGEHRTLTAVMTGARVAGTGTLTGTVHSAGTVAPFVGVSLSGPGLPQYGVTARTAADGTYALEAPEGTYQATFASGGIVDAPPLTVPVTVRAGTATPLDADLPPHPIAAGAGAHATDAMLAHLNAERVRWGLPGGVTANATWSAACGSHDLYMATNKRIEHPETQKLPGASPGGGWAGMHAVLAQDDRWTDDHNPWDDAPYHLEQLFAPDLVMTGIDVSRGYACATTWPGMFGPVGLPGTVMTYPGDGTTGLPPAEDAEEMPGVPGDEVGLPAGTIAGRELLVYETGWPHGPTCVGDCGGSVAPELTAATLTGPGGPVPIKTVTGRVAAIVIPVHPLAPRTRYTATVTLAARDGEEVFTGSLPAVTHTWSFTTGRANPNGRWPVAGAAATPPARRAGPKRSVSARRRDRTHLQVGGRGFRRSAGVVTIHLGPRRGRRLATARVHADGRFSVTFRWTRTRSARLTVTQGRGIAQPVRAPAASRHRAR